MTIAAVADVATGVALLAAGAVTWTRARHSRTGPLLALSGAAWLVGDIASALVYAHRGRSIAHRRVAVFRAKHRGARQQQ